MPAAPKITENKVDMTAVVASFPQMAATNTFMSFEYQTHKKD